MPAISSSALWKRPLALAALLLAGSFVVATPDAEADALDDGDLFARAAGAPNEVQPTMTNRAGSIVKLQSRSNVDWDDMFDDLWARSGGKFFPSRHNIEEEGSKKTCQCSEAHAMDLPR